MIKSPAPQLSEAKKDAPKRALKPLEEAAASAQDCLWQRVRSQDEKHKQDGCCSQAASCLDLETYSTACYCSEQRVAVSGLSQKDPTC